MGCASSRFDNSILPFARPAFLHRIERRNSQTLSANITFSKKELLSDHKEDDHNIIHVSRVSPDHDEQEIIQSCLNSEGSEKDKDHHHHHHATGINDGDSKNGELIRDKESKRPIENSTKCESEFDEDDYRDERMLRRKDEELGFPASPSFRVYFNDNDHGDNFDKALEDNPQDIAKVDSPVSQEVEIVVGEEEKKEKKGRSFRKVLPAGHAAIKNLLNVRSCMSNHHHHHQHQNHHILTPKTPA